MSVFNFEHHYHETWHMFDLFSGNSLPDPIFFFVKVPFTFEGSYDRVG